MLHVFSQKHNLLCILFLIIICVCAGIARWIGLDHLLIWHDEVFTLIRIFGFSSDEIKSVLFNGQFLKPEDLLNFQRLDPRHNWINVWQALARNPEHSPLYYFLAHLVANLSIEPIVAARGVSAFAGTLIIPAAWWLMRELKGQLVSAWIVAALLACSPLEFLYAQEAREYALWILFIILTNVALLRAVNNFNQINWLIYSIFLTLSFYSHVLSLLIIPAHALFLLTNTISYYKNSPAICWKWVKNWFWAVGSAVILFLPWIWIFITQFTHVQSVTAWLQRPLAINTLLTLWIHHILSNFVALEPHLDSNWKILLLPLGWMMIYFLRHGPRLGIWIFLYIILIYIGFLLIPDLMMGGSRSLQARYALPALFTLHFIVAWFIGELLIKTNGSWQRQSGCFLLIIFLGLGCLSLFAIQRADTWSTKAFSASNRVIAQRANTTAANTLIIVNDSEIAVGELLSLVHLLKPEVRIWGQNAHTCPHIPMNFQTIIALTPTPSLSASFEHPLLPLEGTWQWLIASD